MNLKILYRGSLSSCNYGCVYCPFAKRKESREELEKDRHDLERFVEWVAARDSSDRISVFFTPWGEALIRTAYQHALIRLTNLPHVEKAAIQTNISCRLEWVEACNKEKLALWATFHPEWVPRHQFVAKALELDRRGVKFSAGVVGFPRFKEEIRALRQELPPHIYLWINAVKRELPNMSDDDLRFFDSIDPLFRHNTHHYPTYGRACRAGSEVISVAGDGTVRRCHFIKQPIGNLYDPNFGAILNPRPCTNHSCHCHIGYVHLEHLPLDNVFGRGILERIPYNMPPYKNQ
ncbi:MAG: STM4011 family radical SAM protein [Ardenticatenaceae bacterium]